MEHQYDNATADTGVGGAAGLLTVAEAARYLSISRTTLYRLTDRGEIAVVRLSRDPRFLKSDLDAFIQTKREEMKTTML